MYVTIECKELAKAFNEAVEAHMFEKHENYQSNFFPENEAYPIYFVNTNNAFSYNKPDKKIAMIPLASVIIDDYFDSDFKASIYESNSWLVYVDVGENNYKKTEVNKEK